MGLTYLFWHKLCCFTARIGREIPVIPQLNLYKAWLNTSYLKGTAHTFSCCETRYSIFNSDFQVQNSTTWAHILVIEDIVSQGTEYQFCVVPLCVSSRVFVFQQSWTLGVEVLDQIRSKRRVTVSLTKDQSFSTHLPNPVEYSLNKGYPRIKNIFPCVYQNA